MKKNIPLIFALSIPVLLIIGVALSIYLPTLFTKPQYGFLYSTGGDYNYHNEYAVENGKLVKKPVTLPPYVVPTNSKEPELYTYDVQKNSNTKISFEETQTLNLDSNPQSPDSFEITYGSDGGGVFPFFFWSDRDYGSRYLKGHGVTKKIDLHSSSPYNYYSGDFQFLGWIKK